MSQASVGLTRVTVASQIGQDDSEPTRELAGNFVPNDVCLGIAMKK
jgi:hypothetical protein